jgi:hypothetical protein
MYSNEAGLGSVPLLVGGWGYASSVSRVVSRRRPNAIVVESLPEQRYKFATTMKVETKFKISREVV